MPVCTWHSVSSGFFPPESLSHSCQEQVADHAEDQVAFQSQVQPALIVVEPHLSLVVLETALHPPAREGHQEHCLDRHLRPTVADEKLDLIGVEDVAGHDQMHLLPRQAVLALGREPAVFDLPDHRSLLSVLDPPPLPRLVPQVAPFEHLVNPLRCRTAASQAWDLAVAAAATTTERPRHDPGCLEPADKVPGDFTHEPLTTCRETPQETGLTAVPLIEGDPVKAQAVANRAIVQLQADLPLRAVHHSLGDP